MQIRRIVLYNAVGQMRELKFRLGRVNVLTGPSGRGKSAVLSVIDYCLGAGRLGVPAGVIQDTVAWYAVELDFSGERMFIARPSVAGDRRASPNWHISFGEQHDPPPILELTPSFRRDDLLAKISAKLGIGTTMVPRADGSAERRRLSFRSSIIYCFQKQNEVANPDLYFHRQGETGAAQTIRETLPYYLGAVSEDIIERQERLKGLRRRYNDIQKQLRRLDDIGGRRDQEAAYLMSEARRSGLLNAPITPTATVEESLGLLQQAEAAALSTNIQSGGDVLAEKSQRLMELQTRRSDLQREIENLEAFGRDQALVQSGINEQQARLYSLYLIPEWHDDAQNVCPLCHSALLTPTPTAQEMELSLRRLGQDLSFVSLDRSEVAESLARWRTSLKEVEAEIAEVRTEIARLREQDNSVRTLLESRNEMARVSGMIHMFLRIAERTSAEDRVSLEAEATALEQAIEELEQETNFDAVKTRTATFLGGVGQTITAWAREQSLEYANGLLTFDIRGPQLVSESEAGTIPFSRFGSGKNWVWYHLLGHMALHKWFIDKQRPTPRFLVIDQPSQVYFPSGHPNEGATDLDEVRRIYDWLFARTAECDGNIQVIVTDHARFADNRFVDHVAHDWWEKSEALIPADWYQSG